MLIANTFGWDTVYGIRFSDANKAILDNYNGLTDYTQTSSEGFVLSGDFNPWQMTGGSGRLLMMEITGPDFTLENYPTSSSSDITKLNPVYTVEVELELVPRTLPESSRAEDGQPMDLMLKLPGRAGAPEMARQTNVVSVTWDGFDDENPSDILLASAVRQMMIEWFNKPEVTPGGPSAMESLNSVFATVNLNQRIDDADGDNGHFEWISPSAVAYGVTSSDGPDGSTDGILALMCMGKGRADLAADLGNTVSPALLPALERSGFLISKDRFLENMLLPGLGGVFADGADKTDAAWPAANFALSGNGSRLENINDIEIAQLNIKPSDDPDDDPEYVTATIPAGGAQFTITDTELEIRFQNLSHLYTKQFGVYLMNATHQITATTFAALNENKQFVLVPGFADEDADGENDLVIHNVALTKTEAGDTVDWVLFSMDVAGFLLTAYSGARAFKAAKDVKNASTASFEAMRAVSKTDTGFTQAKMMRDAAKLAKAADDLTPNLLFWQKWEKILFGLTFAFTAAVMTKQMIEQVTGEQTIKDNSIPDAGKFAAAVMKPVQWPGTTGFEISSVQFNGGLHILGTPTFAE